MAAKKKPTADAVEILHRLYFEGNPDRLAALETARAEAEIAQITYDLRTKSRLTHGQLARRVGVTAAVIRSLEDSDYESDSQAMLRRIAAALGQRIEPRVLAAGPESSEPERS